MAVDWHQDPGHLISEQLLLELSPHRWHTGQTSPDAILVVALTVNQEECTIILPSTIQYHLLVSLDHHTLGIPIKVYCRTRLESNGLTRQK